MSSSKEERKPKDLEGMLVKPLVIDRLVKMTIDRGRLVKKFAQLQIDPKWRQWKWVFINCTQTWQTSLTIDWEMIQSSWKSVEVSLHKTWHLTNPTGALGLGQEDTIGDFSLSSRRVAAVEWIGHKIPGLSHRPYPPTKMFSFDLLFAGIKFLDW